MVRVLCTFVGGRGHLEPILPIAHAARAAGHDVAFTSGRSMAPVIEAAGFEILPMPPPADDGDGTAAASPAASEPKLLPLLAVDRAREERDLREKFARDGARLKAPRILAQAARWQPNVILTDEADFGTVIAAERLGIPCATVVVLIAGGMLRPDVVAAPLDEVRSDFGLPPDPDLLLARGRLAIDPAPPGFRDPADPLRIPSVAVSLAKPVRADATGGPPWQPVRPDGPAVYATLGTVFNLESGDLLARVIAAFADHPGDVLVTVGDELDPGAFDVPPHIHVERFVPQAAILPHVELIVSHAGSGTVLGALAHGLPMVLIPMGADQPWNGDRCVALGVARALDPIAATPDDIRAAAQGVLGDRSFRDAAARLARAMDTEPGPEAAVAALEKLAAADTR
jgi:UDP:flavonoid glycosyltransferase YjiC (YdhE family)